MARRLDDLHVVSHTHWDREWYHTADVFRQRLVRLIDELLDDPPAAGESFLLDGQAILLDDYLDVRPERAAELSDLLRDGRIETGPWYVLGDNLIPSGEALVRNLLAGREALRRLRADTPPVLYCPDTFGHPAILPDLAAGFGCELIVLWRGLGGARTPASDVVRWRGVNGNSVLVYHLPPDGYEYGSSLPTSPDEARARWARILDVMQPRSVAGVSILFNGADHHARQRDRDPAVTALARSATPVRVHASSLRSASRSIIDAAAHHDIEEVHGELRDSYGYTWTLQGTLGTRAFQKRSNAIAERRLLRDVEPWIALSDRAGDATARALLKRAWRTLLAAHPHDTLCGTSIDTVAEAFDARVESASDQACALRDATLLQLVGHDVERAREVPSAWKPAVLVRNPAARARGGVVELTLRATITDVAVGPGSAMRQGAPRRPAPFRIDGVALQPLERRERVALTESPRAYPDADLILEASAVGWIDPLHGYSVSTRFQNAFAPKGKERRGASSFATIPNPVATEKYALDNGRVRVEITDDGCISIEDRELGRRIDNVISFERSRDVGDLYTPAIRESLASPTIRRIRLTHRGPVRGELVLDYVLGDKGLRDAGHLELVIQLDADSRAIRMRVNGENLARNHRLRACFATALPGASTVADAAFFPISRTPLAIQRSDAEMEQVVPTAPLHRWVARFGVDAGVAIVSDGLAEYESDDDGGLFVTLVRAVGDLSRVNLPERPGHAGWPVSTPGAQCIGPYAARFALRLIGEDSPATRMQIEHLSEDFLQPIVGETLRSNLGDQINVGGIELRGDGLTFSSFAPASREGWMILRCVNQRDIAVEGEWWFAQPIAEAERTRLDETWSGALSPTGNVINFTASPHEIITILAR